jgi:two-component system sensor histidine kinase AlgZ
MGGVTLLDALAEQPPAPAATPPGPASPFDACHGGVVWRVLVFVHGVTAIALLFVAVGLGDWLVRLALAATWVLPATLAWLVTACLGRRAFDRLAGAAQWGAVTLLGAALAGLSAAWVAGLHGLSDGSEVPPWHAAAVAGGALGAAVFHWLRLRAGGMVPAATTARLAELQARIRPHFLFNTLNSAIALVQVDPDRAEAVLEDLAELFRSALRDPGSPSRLGDEVELARRYLEIEQVRFGDRLRVHWELDAGAAHAVVPPLLLQPLVENAVKHGVEPSDRGGVIRVRTRVERGEVVVVVTNTVGGGPGKPGHGIALRNLRERLRLLHDVETRFDAGLVEPGVYRVRIVLPLGA